jgi:hypothetical protein
MSRPVFIPKTKEQVEAEIVRAEAFAKEHPYSMFGEDNVHKVGIFKHMCEKYLNGVTIDQLRQDVWDDGDDLDEDDEEGLEENTFEDDIVSWLAGENTILDGNEHFW